MITRIAQAVWYEGHPLGYWLRPLEASYCGAVWLRRRLFGRGWLAKERLPVPVIVVGNVVVGGSGKTPLVLWIAHLLAAKGWRPGIISRGYGGRGGPGPREVTETSDPREVGDEPLLLARRSGIPVAVAGQRAAAGRLLLERYGCHCLISDDGLQHYGLVRDVEIAVTDRQRGLGNGRCLPAGPLREPLSRLAEVDLRVAQGEGERGEYPMTLLPTGLYPLQGKQFSYSLDTWRGITVHGVAGIGHPERFFTLLRNHGLHVIPHPYSDHAPYQRGALDYGDGRPVVMTEKDAVKYIPFAGPSHWYVAVEAQLPQVFGEQLLARLKLTMDSAPRG